MRLHFNSTTSPVAARIRQRIKEEMKSRGITQTMLGDALSRLTREFWSQSKVAKVLNGRVGLQLDDLSAICQVIDIGLAEVVRDRGMEFYAELTPTEVRIIEEIRRDADVQQVVLGILRIRKPADKTAMVRRRRPGRPKKTAQNADS